MNTPATRISLLQRLLDRDDAEAWEAFDAIYRPVIYRLLGKWGLQEADRHEVAQEVFSAVSQSLRKFHHREDIGSFRGWLTTITRNKLVDMLKSRERLPESIGGSDFQTWLAECPQPESLASAGQGLSRWDLEQRRALFAWAAKKVQHKVQPSTWRAFQQTAVRGVAPCDVAKEMKTTVGWVYVARSRVLARLRELVEATGEIEWGPEEDHHAM